MLNIDHHHDNTRFGTVNLVVGDASCTAEILGLAKELGAEITPPIADALYVALVTDTGRFMYENTPEAHLMAAELIQVGVALHDVYRRLYEDLPFPRLELPVAGAVERRAPRRRDDHGRHLTKTDFEETEALETDAEGIVDHMRAVEGDGGRGARPRAAGRRPRRQVQGQPTRHGRAGSTPRDRADHGRRRPPAGGQATTELPYDELIETLREQIAAQLQG